MHRGRRPPIIRRPRAHQALRVPLGTRRPPQRPHEPDQEQRPGDRADHDARDRAAGHALRLRLRRRLPDLEAGEWDVLRAGRC